MTRAIAAVLSVCFATIGCADKTPQKAREVQPVITRDVPNILRGTIGAEATLLKADPLLVSGYGLVVGLPGTGGGDLDQRLLATMDRQLGLMGIGKASSALDGTPLEGKSPMEVLRSRDVAVVIVYAAVIPGAPRGAIFDVFVRAASNSPDISIEGGTLWSTDLQIGPATQFGGIQTRKIAVARGPIFINAFADPAAREGMGRRDGRILGGGLVTAPLDLELILDNESSSRASAIASAVNNRFPPPPGGEPTARGRNSRLINVTVPAAYRERATEFLELLKHTQIDPTMPQEYARRYVEALKTQPFLGDELSWCLQALPQKAALPFLRELYDWPEMVPRLAALRAGAGLGDPLAAPHLRALASQGPAPLRADAISLLGRLNAGPTVDLALKEQLNARELAVRVAAYDALAERAEQVYIQRWAASRPSIPPSVRVAWNSDEETPAGILEMAGDTIQGVRRKVIGEKFILDTVPQGSPLIYVTQQGRPRIVLFGSRAELRKPCLVSTWGDRLMAVADSPTDDVRIMYRTPDRMLDSGDVFPGRTITSTVKPDLASLIEFMAHTPSPEDPRQGLGMSYSEVVGALYALQRGGAMDAVFAAEDDLLRARLLEAANSQVIEDRPETPTDEVSLKVYEAVDPTAPPPVAPDKPDLVVPLPPPVKKSK